MILRGAPRGTEGLAGKGLLRATAIAALVATLLPSGALAQSAPTGPEAEEKPWSVMIAPYLWVAGFDGSITAPFGGSVSSSQSFSQIASNLDAGFAGVIDIRYRRLHVFSDNSWVELSSSTYPSGPVIAQTDLTFETAFGTAAVAYALPLDWPMQVDLYLGGRWWHNSVDVTALTGGGGVVTGGAEQVWGDAVGGVRLFYPITPRWDVALMGDVGGGGSDLTWMITGTLSWMFTDHVGAAFAYRVLGVDYETSGWTYDVKQQGFITGLKLVF
jgi:hypothetical protein